jgi:hypothetical protein
MAKQAEVVEKRDDAIGWSGVAFELSARKLGSDCSLTGSIACSLTAANICPAAVSAART